MTRPRSFRRFVLNGGLLLVASVLSLFLAEAVLAVLKFPAESHRQVAHPPNYEETRSTLEFDYVFRTNDHGLRYRDIPEDKPAGSHRVFVIGDSFTEGYGVATGKRFTDLLEQRFSAPGSPVLFINGGLTGTGPLEYGRVFVNVGLKYDVDALLIVLYPNDVWNSSRIVARPFAEDPPGPTGIRRLVRIAWPRLYTLLQSARDRERRRRQDAAASGGFVEDVSRMARERGIAESRIEQWKAALPPALVDTVDQGRFNGGEMANGLLHPEYWEESIDVSSAAARKNWKTMTDYLAGILEIAQQKGIESAIVLVPSPLLYDARKHSADTPGVLAGPRLHERWLQEDTQIQKLLGAWTAEKGVPYLDLTPALRAAYASGRILNFELDEHFNETGNRVAADAIAAWLSDQHVFSFTGGGGSPDDRAASSSPR
jgi:hypothetical protein